MGFLAIVVVVIAAAGPMMTNDLTADRTIVIATPPENIFAHVNSLENFNAWSPWAAGDGGSTYGVEVQNGHAGADMVWKSDSYVGCAGSGEVAAARPGARVRTALDCSNSGALKAGEVFTSEYDDSQVIWQAHTDVGDTVVQRYFGLVNDNWNATETETGTTMQKTPVKNPSS